jgi:hypothetical protein
MFCWLLHSGVLFFCFFLILHIPYPVMGAWFLGLLLLIGQPRFRLADVELKVYVLFSFGFGSLLVDAFEGVRARWYTCVLSYIDGYISKESLDYLCNRN